MIDDSEKRKPLVEVNFRVCLILKTAIIFYGHIISVCIHILKLYKEVDAV